MVYSLFSAIIAFFFPAIAKDKDIFFSYLVSIEALSVVSPALMFNPARIVNRFSAVFSAFAKSLS
jgi:hypothetical protein